MKARLHRKAIRTLGLRFVLAAFLGILVVAAMPGAYAQTKATVRGRVDRQGDSKSYPAAYVSVSLRGVQSVYTGGDGMYYIQDVMPGDYKLEILDPGGRAIRSFAIHVPAGQQYVDIAPIVIP
jgi:Carboxypeptidase regulatory-like domain